MGTCLGTHLPRFAAVLPAIRGAFPRYHVCMKSFFVFLAILALCLWSIRAAFFVWLFGAVLVLLVLLALALTPRR